MNDGESGRLLDGQVQVDQAGDGREARGVPGEGELLVDGQRGRDGRGGVEGARPLGVLPGCAVGHDAAVVCQCVGAVRGEGGDQARDGDGRETTDDLQMQSINLLDSRNKVKHFFNLLNFFFQLQL